VFDIPYLSEFRGKSTLSEDRGDSLLFLSKLSSGEPAKREGVAQQETTDAKL
jgi:hypothetical protein